MGKKTIELTEQEQVKLAQAENRDFYERVRNLVSDQSWTGKVDAQKREAIDVVRKYEDQQRKRRVAEMRADLNAALARDSL